jgi:hypothetical protein
LRAESWRDAQRGYRLDAARPFPPDAPVLLTWPSASLADIGKRLMKVSQNLYAETLLRELAVSDDTGDGARRCGRRALDAEGLGVADGGIAVADGSGSRATTRCPRRPACACWPTPTRPRLKGGWMAAMPVGVWTVRWESV